MRQNKAMPESPAIVAKVTKALHSGRRTGLWLARPATSTPHEGWDE